MYLTDTISVVQEAKIQEKVLIFQRFTSGMLNLICIRHCLDNQYKANVL